MLLSPRNRFIFFATLGYALLSLLWIYFSDLLLATLVDPRAMQWLSTAKGMLFVAISSAILFILLQTVPSPAGPLGRQSPLIELAMLPPGLRLLVYALALLTPAAMLWLRLQLPVDLAQRPMLVMFVFPILLSGLLGGLGPGLVATLETALLVDYFIMLPAPGFGVAAGHDLLQWSFLIANGVVISLFSQMSHQAMRRLQLNRRLLSSVVTGSSDAIFVKDVQGRYLLANQAAAGFVGKPVELIVGRDDHELFPKASAELIRELDRGVMARSEPQTHEEQITTLDGKDMTFLVTKGPVFDRHGQVAGLFGISRDITERKHAEAMFNTAQQLAGLGSWEWDLREDRHVWSEQLYHMYGRDPSLPPLPYAELEGAFTDESRARLSPLVAACREHGEPYVCDAEMVLADGSQRWLSIRGQARRDALGNTVQLFGTVQDITTRKLAELAQREASAVFESCYEGIMVVSPEKTIVRTNPAFTRITGYTAEEVQGQSPRMLASGRHGAAFYHAMWQELDEHGLWCGEIWNRRKSGELYAEQLSIVVVRGANEQVQYYIGMFSDISQLKAHAAELDRIAHYDPLTGLPNRRLLVDRLGQAIQHCRRSRKSLAVCFLDLDGFKAVNDQLGHSAGDQLLIGVSDHLKEVLRGDDTLARLGGDEFVLILVDVHSAEECALILERILHAVRLPVAVDGMLVEISASVGVSLFPDDNADGDTLLRHADQAMYLAKEAGRNRYHLFDPESDRKAQDRGRALEELRLALERRQFVLHYQPKVDLRDGRVVGAEALVRWQHPERGLVPPGEFLPHLHGSELEAELGEWIMQAALQQLSAWHGCGLPLTLSVNISANHLLRENFASHLGALLAGYSRSLAEHFELEVLESAAIADVEKAAGVLQQCRQLGVRFALDDFGTGYSSLTYLRKLPIDVLKIDQSFVRDMLQDADDLGIVESVVRLALVFDLEVVAEGVETLEHGTALLQLGCHLAQGYGVARPMPAERVLDWVGDWQQVGAWREITPC